MAKKLFPKYPPFINRIAETKYLNDYLKNVPTAIQFIYWPKSTWKTTLINKVINELPQEDYAIQYIDMRSILIRDFDDFRSIFFPKDIKWKIKEIASWIKINVGIFGWDVDDEKALETNVFEVMERKLKKANEKWIRPVIIIDEFQYLKDIVIEWVRRVWDKPDLLLVEELWKFFIRLTKVSHLAHVICLTSDSYYIEELYSHTKLKNTSKYYLVDHLEKKDIVWWLESEDFSPEVIEYFWENLGWSVWEIWQALLDYKNTWEYKSTIETMIDDEYAKVYDLIENRKLFVWEELKKFIEISKIIANNWEYIARTWDNLYELIKKTVDLDVWFYDARKQRITANSQTVRKAFERFLKIYKI